MNDSVRYERCQQIQLGVLSESQEGVDILANSSGSEPELPQGTGNVSQTSPKVFVHCLLTRLTHVAHCRYMFLISNPGAMYP